MQEQCEIIYTIIEEKWSIFPKETAQFHALTKQSDGNTVIAKSAKFGLEKFNTLGPSDKNKKHKAAFDGLVDKLTADGWERCGQGDYWFHQVYRRNMQP